MIDRIDTVHVVRFDFAVLIEVDSAETAEKIHQNSIFKAMLPAIKWAASYKHLVAFPKPEN